LIILQLWIVPHKHITMDKKDIYEHLAKIYLDASAKKQVKPKPAPKLFRNLFVIALAAVFILSGALIAASTKPKLFNTEIALILMHDPLKINFDFNPAKKELYTLNLNGLDLTRYKALSFAVKKANPRDSVSLRVEMSNDYNEKSEVYCKELSSSWKDQTFTLNDFKMISDWTHMKQLSFVVEEWNTTEKQGVVYIDNLRVLK